QHVEENLEIRSKLAGALRSSILEMDPATQTIARRVIRALENTGYDLRNVGVVVRTYTAYLFDRLQSLEDGSASEQDARRLIEAWNPGTFSTEKLSKQFRHFGPGAAGLVPDLLLDDPKTRRPAETAVSILSGIRSAISARVLAHVIAEPMLDED